MDKLLYFWSPKKSSWYSLNFEYLSKNIIVRIGKEPKLVSLVFYMRLWINTVWVSAAIVHEQEVIFLFILQSIIKVNLFKNEEPVSMAFKTK